MTIHETLRGCKLLLGMEVLPDIVKIDLKSDKLVDGTEIQYAELIVGSTIEILQDDTYLPAPIGDYTLESGDVVKVIEEGIIGEIVLAEVLANEVPVEVPINTDVQDQIDELQKSIDELLLILQELMGATALNKTSIETLSTQVTELADAPAAEPLIKTNLAADNKSTRYDNLDLIKQLKNK